MDIFAVTDRIDPKLLYAGHDPKDRRLGEVVSHRSEDYEDARFVILGCPEDEGVRRNRGRPGARHAPARIRRHLYAYSLASDRSSGPIFDLGDIRPQSTLEATHGILRKAVRRVLQDGKTAIILGGGNDISYPDCAALAEEEKSVLVFNIDKHFDVRDLDPRNSGTAYRLLLEGGLVEPDNFYEMGSESFANSPVYRRYLEDMGAHIYSLSEMREAGIRDLFNTILAEKEVKAIFWGFDLDVVRSQDAPGVSAGSPTGLSAGEMMEIAAAAGRDPRSRVLEFTEVNPELDVDDRTSKLTALLIHTVLFSP
jgi:formiminoglutamase